MERLFQSRYSQRFEGSSPRKLQQNAYQIYMFFFFFDFFFFASFIAGTATISRQGCVRNQTTSGSGRPSETASADSNRFCSNGIAIAT